MDIDPDKQLDLVKGKSPGDAPGRALLHHKRREWVKNTEGAYYQEDSKGKYRVLQGLLPRLKFTYWPKSSYAKVKKMVKSVRGTGIMKSKKRRKSRGRFQGLIKGKEVHRQLKDFIQQDKKGFDKLHPRGLHDYTERVLRAVSGTMGWRPFIPELDIFDEDLGIGTSIDGVALDPDGNLILQEYKTGYKDYFHARDGCMTRSLAKLANSMKNRASLQLTASALILMKHYGVKLEHIRLFVIRVDDDTIDIVPVDNRFLETAGPLIYQDLLVANTERKKEKERERAKKKKKRTKAVTSSRLLLRS